MLNPLLEKLKHSLHLEERRSEMSDPRQFLVMQEIFSSELSDGLLQGGPARQLPIMRSSASLQAGIPAGHGSG
jgi:hypothetical protein